jgi:ABC-type sugar transport system permease subunit
MLAVFIAYPFVMGDLALAHQHQRGQPGQVRRRRQLQEGLERLDLPDRVLEHVLLHVLGDGVQAGARACGSRCCSTATSASSGWSAPPCCCRSSSHRALDLRLALDVRPHLQRAELAPLPGSAGSPTKLPFLSDGTWAMWCAIVVNTWRGMPFFAITLLAGLQTINPDLHEAAALDGANAWRRFWHVTWPLLQAGHARGGGVLGDPDVLRLPAHLRAHRRRAGQLDPPPRHLRLPDRVASGLLGEGAAISLFMFPVLFLVVWIQLRYLKRLEGAEGPDGDRARWKKWVFFYIPLAVFIVFTLFPFYWMLVTAIRPDAELYRSWRAEQRRRSGRSSRPWRRVRRHRRPVGLRQVTLLRMVAGLEEITGGEIAIGGRVVNELEPKDRDIAMVFQNYALYPHMSVYDNMAFGLKIRKLPKAEIDARVDAPRRRSSSSTPLLERKPRQLSAASASAWRWAAPSCASPRCSCSTSRCPTSTPSCACRCARDQKLHQRLGTTSALRHPRPGRGDDAGRPHDRDERRRIEQIGTPLEVYDRPANHLRRRLHRLAADERANSAVAHTVSPCAPNARA